MRLCKADGTLELISKIYVSEKGEDYKPWFTHPPKEPHNYSILFGHWAALQGDVEQHNIYALDTGCVWGGQLSMLRLEDKEWFRCECK